MFVKNVNSDHLWVYFELLLIYLDFSVVCDVFSMYIIFTYYKVIKNLSH